MYLDFVCEVERRVTQIRLVKARRQWNEILLYVRSFGHDAVDYRTRGRGSKIFNRNLLKGSDMGGWIIHRNLINRFDTLLFRNPRAKRVLDGKDNARPIGYFASSGFKLMLHY